MLRRPSPHFDLLSHEKALRQARLHPAHHGFNHGRGEVSGEDVVGAGERDELHVAARADENVLGVLDGHHIVLGAVDEQPRDFDLRRGIEQVVRDARVAMIYEGTNEIQAIDLLVRKVMSDGAQSLDALLDDLLHSLAAPAKHAPAWQGRVAELRSLTADILALAGPQPALPYEFADDYLRALGVVLLEWAWLKIGLAATEGTADRQDRWGKPAQALQRWVVPEFSLRVGMIRTALEAAQPL